MAQQTKWELVCNTPTVGEMPKFHIFRVEKHSHSHKTNESRMIKEACDIYDDADPSHGFEFKFDPFKLKYTNSHLP